MLVKNFQYYLYNSSSLNGYWWTMTPSYFNGSYSFVLDSYVAGSFFANINVSVEGGVRPVINLDAKVLYDSGVGTSDSPYTVKLSET